jgi:TonB family protein
MSEGETLFRRNMVIAVVAHVAVISALVVCESVAERARAVPQEVEVVTLGDIQGDLPVGPGKGRGAYTAPREPAPVDHTPNTGDGASPPPSDSSYAPDESPAPEPAPAPVRSASSPETVHSPGDVYVPHKGTKPPKPAAAAAAATQGKKPQTKPVSASPTKLAATSSATAGRTGTKPGGTGTGRSASEIRNLFASALKGSGSGGGTQYGDGKTAGGGTGRSSVIGSPDGTKDGVPGGIGKGTPFAWYYQHVHDRMYESWEQPGQALRDKHLMTIVMLRVSRDGRIMEAWIKDPSGNKLMDDSALTAAKKVQQLDPLPDGLGGESAEISVNFQLEG